MVAGIVIVQNRRDGDDDDGGGGGCSDDDDNPSPGYLCKLPPHIRKSLPIQTLQHSASVNYNDGFYDNCDLIFCLSPAFPPLSGCGLKIILSL